MCGCICARYGLGLIMVLVFCGFDVLHPSLPLAEIIVVFGPLCALTALAIDADVFNEMAEVFLGVPNSDRTRTKFLEEFWAEL